MWKLMHNEAISLEDKKIMCDFILSSPKLTYGPKIKEFEKKWSEWLGCKYSVFVNSGSSANLLIVQAAHDLYGQGNWAAQSCTWSTNIAPIIQLQKNTGLHLTDVDLKTLGPDLNDLENMFKTEKIKYFFLTHVLGIPSVNSKLIDLCNKYNVILFEDCCESHGSTFNNQKVGTFGLASSFSFFYGHHITTIEGGMICTNDETFYHKLLLLRSHGLLRELPEEERQKNIIHDVDQRFTFLCPGYNVRNTDVHAVLGLNQMKRLDNTIKIRNENFNYFCKNLNNKKYYVDFETDGVSLFAFPVICKDVDKQKVFSALTDFNVEFRPLIAGNLLRHPMMKHVNIKKHHPMANYIHDNSYYIGNNETVTIDMVKKLVEVLNSL
jgi:CDP-4-dehydro-6-deoxyglucose reductase, E1